MQINTRTNTVKLTKHEGSTLVKAVELLQAVAKHTDHTKPASEAAQAISTILADLDPGAEPSK